MQGRSPEKTPPITDREAGGVSDENDQLKSRLAEAESDLQETTDRMVEVEHQRGRLMGLYVATCELHETLDLEEVKRTVGEIAVELLGADSFALLLRQGETERLRGGGFAPNRWGGRWTVRRPGLHRW